MIAINYIKIHFVVMTFYTLMYNGIIYIFWGKVMSKINAKEFDLLLDSDEYGELTNKYYKDEITFKEWQNKRKEVWSALGLSQKYTKSTP
jgi:hypothetical protein